VGGKGRGRGIAIAQAGKQSQLSEVPYPFLPVSRIMPFCTSKTACMLTGALALLTVVPECELVTHSGRGLALALAVSCAQASTHG